MRCVSVLVAVLMMTMMTKEVLVAEAALEVLEELTEEPLAEEDQVDL